jgi:hypothetical protein
MHRLLSWVDKRDTYLVVMLLDLGIAIVLAKLIVHVTQLIASVLF